MDNLDKIYLDLMKNGYKHNEVDDMDIDHFLSLIDEKEEEPKKKKKGSSIEEAFPMF